MKVDLMNIPKMWFIQLMFYLGITCNEKGAVAWLSGNRGFWFDHIDLEFDQELYGLMVQAGVHFWKENVMKDIPPDPQNSEDVQRMYQEHQEGKIADVSDEVYQMHVKLSDIREEIRQLKNIEGEIMEDIKMKYADNEAMRYGGEILSTWKAAKPGCKLDTDKLKKDMPEVYEKYAVERKGSRRFLIK